MRGGRAVADPGGQVGPGGQRVGVLVTQDLLTVDHHPLREFDGLADPPHRLIREGEVGLPDLVIDGCALLGVSLAVDLALGQYGTALPPPSDLR